MSMSKLENQPCIAVIQIFLLKYCTSDPAANALCRGHHQLSVCENRLKIHADARSGDRIEHWYKIYF